MVDCLIIFSFFFCFTEERSWEIYWGRGTDAFKNFSWIPRVNNFSLTQVFLCIRNEPFAVSYITKHFHKLFVCFSPCWFMCLWLSTSPTVLWLLMYGSSRSEWGYPTIFLQNPGPSSRTYSVTRSMQEFPQRDDSVFPHCRWDSTIFSNLVVINLIRGYQAIVFGDL